MPLLENCVSRVVFSFLSFSFLFLPGRRFDVESRERKEKTKLSLSFPEPMDADLLPVLSYGGVAASAAAGTSNANKKSTRSKKANGF